MTPIYFFQGPLRLPVCATTFRFEGHDESDELRPAFTTLPRGVAAFAAAQGGEGPAAWARVAPALESMLPSLRAGGQAGGPLAPWLEACRDAGVLTWRDSAGAARAFLETLHDDASLREACRLPAPEAWRGVACWQVKEGQTASVWHVAVQAEGEAPPHACCINVPRDARASEELARTTAHLRELGARDAGHVARVFAHCLVDPAAPGLPPLFVSALEWVPGRELHAPRGADDLVEIGWFLDAPAEPGTRQRVFGRRLDDAEQAAVASQARAFLARHATLSPNGTRVTLPVFELNEGDAVWADGRLVIVALSDAAHTVAADDWAQLCASAEPWWHLMRAS